MPRLSIGLEQVFTNLGIVGNGYKLFFFSTGTMTPKTTYSNEGLSVQNTNPIILNSAGRPDVGIWGSDPSLYRMILGTPDSVLGNITTVVDVDPVDNYSVNNIAGLTPIPTAYWGTTAGTSAAYTLDPALVNIASYSNEQTFFIDFHIACSAGANININNIGSLGLKKLNLSAVKVSLVENDLLPKRYLAYNDGVDIIITNPEYPYINSTNLSQATSLLVGVSYTLSPIRVSNNSSDSNNYMDFTAGVANFSDGSQATFNSTNGSLGAVFGSGAGMLDTGTKQANKIYYLFVVQNPTTGILKPLASASYSNPTMPSGYTKKCYRGALKTDSSGNILGGGYNYNTDGSYIFNYLKRQFDVTVNGATGDTATYSISVPAKYGITANLIGCGNTGTAPGDVIRANFDSIYTDLTIGTSSEEADLSSIGDAMRYSRLSKLVYAPTAQVKVYFAQASTTRSLRIITAGWIDNGF